MIVFMLFALMGISTFGFFLHTEEGVKQVREHHICSDVSFGRRFVRCQELFCADGSSLGARVKASVAAAVHTFESSPAHSCCTEHGGC